MRFSRPDLPEAAALVLIVLVPTGVLAQGGVGTPPAPLQAVTRAVVGGTLPEFNFDGMPPFPTAAQTVGTFSYTIPAGEMITSATVNGQFGNSTFGSSAPIQVFVDGVLVATCLMTDPCFNGVDPWSFPFSPAHFPLLPTVPRLQPASKRRSSSLG